MILTLRVFENWYRALCNLIMEIANLTVFISMVWFHNVDHNKLLQTIIIIILVGSQLLISGLTFIEMGYNAVVWLKNRKNRARAGMLKKADLVAPKPDKYQPEIHNPDKALRVSELQKTTIHE